APRITAHHCASLRSMVWNRSARRWRRLRTRRGSTVLLLVSLACRSPVARDSPACSLPYRLPTQRGPAARRWPSPAPPAAGRGRGRPASPPALFPAHVVLISSRVCCSRDCAPACPLVSASGASTLALRAPHLPSSASAAMQINMQSGHSGTTLEE